jgi:hypothetical protein
MNRKPIYIKISSTNENVIKCLKEFDKEVLRGATVKTINDNPYTINIKLSEEKIIMRIKDKDIIKTMFAVLVGISVKLDLPPPKETDYNIEIARV